MNSHNSYTLIDQQNGNLAFKVLPFEDNVFFDHLQRLNYFSLILVTEGSGYARVDVSEYEVNKNQLFCFTPYQPFLFQSEENFKGVAIHFHSDFFCIVKHHKEVACNGVLFNNIYNSPIVLLSEQDREKLFTIIDDMKEELSKEELAQSELILSYLKVFLIQATRIKVSQTSRTTLPDDKSDPILLQNLKDAIEINFKLKHSAGDYANLLGTNSRSLAALVKKYFDKNFYNRSALC